MLVALAILSVGVLIIVELVVRGLPVLPGSRTRAFANVLAQDVVQQLSSGLTSRPDAVCSAVPYEDLNSNGVLDSGEDLNGNDILDYESGFRLVHNVVMNDVNQFSGEDLNGNQLLDPGEDRNGNGVLDLLEDRPEFPTLIVGERFRVPEDRVCGIYMVSRGPIAALYDTTGPQPVVVSRSARVYDPAKTYVRVPAGQEGDGNPATDSLRYSVAYGVTTDVTFDAKNTDRILKVDFSFVAPGGGIEDIIGYTLTVRAGNNKPDPPNDPLPFAVIRYSETIHELVKTGDLNGNGILDPDEDLNGNGILDPGEDLNGNGILDPGEDRNGNGILDDGVDPRAGTIWGIDGTILGGTTLAVDYQIATHRRAGLEGAFFVGEREFRNLDVPDILSFNTIIPVASPEDLNGNGILDPGEDTNGNGTLDHEVRLPLPFIHEDHLDAVFPEPVPVVFPKPVAAVDLVNGNVYTIVGENSALASDPTTAGTINFIDGTIVFKDQVNVPVTLCNPAGVQLLGGRPIRVYFHAGGNWSVELHAAPAQCALMYFDQDLGSLAIDTPSAPAGPKQFWYFADIAPDPDTGQPTARLTFYGEVLGGNVVGKADDDFQRVEVDYIYIEDTNGNGQIDPTDQPRRVIGETHLINHVTHAVFLDHPVILTDADSRDRPLAVRGLSLKARVVWEEDFRRRHADLDAMLPQG